MNKITAIKGITILAKAFPDKEIDADIILSYCSDISDSSFLNAIDRIILNYTEINKSTNLVALIRHNSVKENLYPAELAWADVLKEAKRCGARREFGWLCEKQAAEHKPVFPNKASERATEVIGWQNICLKDDLSYDRKCFIDSYNAYNEYSLREVLDGISHERSKEILSKIGIVK